MCSDALEFGNSVSLHRTLAAIEYVSRERDLFAKMLFDAMMRAYTRLLEDYKDEERDFDIYLWSYVHDFNTEVDIFSFKYFDKGTDKLSGIANVTL